MNTDKIYAEQIANEYSAKKETKVVQLRKLDAAVKKPPMIFALTFGIIMSLVLGVGMCLCMKVIGPNNTVSMVLGIIIGVIGIIGMAINYPIYKKLLESRKKKYAADIINLAKEISDQKE